ncbi:hypothetical protein Zmor_026551 [Zophobas morio]|uniref:Uncharacterized protein n=1 Tax=Zophobas morio TaxID=2755281 RepID=A0AA38M614_9CUCU|nr:hypothetical protein Zmor_026551 [Zophobas morio]
MSVSLTSYVPSERGGKTTTGVASGGDFAPSSNEVVRLWSLLPFAKAAKQLNDRCRHFGHQQRRNDCISFASYRSRKKPLDLFTFFF